MFENRMDPTSEEYALYCEENEDGWHRCYDETEQQFSDDVSASIAARDHDRYSEAESQSRAEFTTVYDILDSLERQQKEASPDLFGDSGDSGDSNGDEEDE